MMAKSIPAIVTPEVLQWARELDRITLEEIAHKLKVEVAKVEAWENGSENPTLPQAKSLAKQYASCHPAFLCSRKCELFYCRTGVWLKVAARRIRQIHLLLLWLSRNNAK